MRTISGHKDISKTGKFLWSTRSKIKLWSGEMIGFPLSDTPIYKYL